MFKCLKMASLVIQVIRKGSFYKTFNKLYKRQLSVESALFWFRVPANNYVSK